MSTDKIIFEKSDGHFTDRWNKVTVWKASGGPGHLSAFIYQCRLNVDIDGSPITYGWDNPALKNSLGGPNLQKNLRPLESWHTGAKGVSMSYSQKAGLGNACGDPGDGTKGWRNFFNVGDGNFYWAGVVAVSKEFAAANRLVIDDRPELEALLSGYKKPKVQRGKGFFPVVQQPGAPNPGYYVSSTSTKTDASLAAWDANRYVDGSTVPYAVWANEWRKLHLNGKSLQLGDFGLVIRPDTGAHTGYLYGDSGTADKVGESSLKLNNVLSGNNSPLCTFIAFPGSGDGPVVGRNPEGKIRSKVMHQTLKLGLASNADELPTRLAMGDMSLPNNTPMSAENARRAGNISKALAAWGLLSLAGDVLDMAAQGVSRGLSAAVRSL